MDRPEQDHEELADQVEEQTDELGRRSEKLEERVMEVRRDWQSKRGDPSVPGAVPTEEETGEPPDAPTDTPTHKQSGD
jgi:hypothetical protein